MFNDQYRRAAEPPDAAQTIKEANWWLQHYRRTGDPRALQCALACHEVALERQRTANLWLTSSCATATTSLIPRAAEAA